MLITKRRSQGIHIFLKIENDEIETGNKMKYLGFLLDGQLTFDLHIKDRVAKNHAAIKTLYPILNRKI